MDDDGCNNELSAPFVADLHEAILANSFAIVQILLERGADPNTSPTIAPIGLVSSSHQERARDLHRTLGRVFRSRRDGFINPLAVAVCNAYHHSSLGRENALKIIVALLEAGADCHGTCSGIAFCKIGSYPSVTVNATKTAAKVALFLKRFPPVDEDQQENCAKMMDEVAAIIFSQGSGNKSKQKAAGSFAKRVWKKMLLDEPSYSDIVFVCPDGKVKAHKCVLATAVPYFYAAFSGAWKENTDPNNEWKTSNSTFVMSAIVQFIYIGEFNEEKWIKEEGELTNLLSAASEYQLDELISRCEICFMSMMTSAKSCKSALLLSMYYNLDNLKFACLKYIQENSATVLMDQSFRSISKEDSELWKEITDMLVLSSLKKAKSDI